MPETKNKKTPKKPKTNEPAQQPPAKTSVLKSAAKHNKTVTATTQKKLPSGYTLLVRTIQLMMANIKLLGGILLIYALVDLVFVGGDSTSTSLPAAKESLMNLFHGHISSLATGFTLFSFLAGS